ncbi:MAG: hypothetical protein ACJAVN_001992 [Roseivirga sp.]|jgi:hypothetical protein
MYLHVDNKKMMKNYIITITLILCAQSVFAQQDLASRDKFKINNQVCYGDSRASVISALGSPTREENDYNEMDEVAMLIIFYGDSRISLENDKLKRFQIKDTSLSTSYENTTISVGLNVNVLAGLFPNSYGARGSNVSQYGINPSVIMTLKAITTGNEERPIDEYVSVLFNPNSQLITEIRHGSW